MKRQFRNCFRLRHRRGLSLVEVLVSSVMLATLAIGALTTVGAVSMSRSRMNDRMKAYALAEQLLSEVMQARYTDPETPAGQPGPDAGEAAPRFSFDDVDDFDQWNAAPPVDRTGTAVPAYAGWRRQVRVQWVTPDSLLTSSSETGLKQVTVRVTDPQGSSLELQGLRTNRGAVEQQPTRDESVVTWIGMQLQIGSDSPPAVSGTSLVNHAHDGQETESPEQQSGAVAY
ncbi:MAG: prepilin-type N-terminal cleavage/methylation domain-containing protein [Fuerstiella sp.]